MKTCPAHRSVCSVICHNGIFDQIASRKETWQDAHANEGRRGLPCVLAFGVGLVLIVTNVNFGGVVTRTCTYSRLD